MPLWIVDFSAFIYYVSGPFQRTAEHKGISGQLLINALQLRYSLTLNLAQFDRGYRWGKEGKLQWRLTNNAQLIPNDFVR